MIVCDMSGIYRTQHWFLEHERWVRTHGLLLKVDAQFGVKKTAGADLTGTAKIMDALVDLRELPGTSCYLDEDAKRVIRGMLAELPENGVHFLDSGNYHYLSLLWMEKIDRDFALVLFDNHPDDQESAFGALTSCGGWVREAREALPCMKKVYSYGIGGAPLTGAVKELSGETLPLYLSIDKDVLSPADAVCNWDQGTATLEKLCEILTEIRKTHKLLGADICGETDDETDAAANEKNARANRRLLQALS